MAKEMLDRMWSSKIRGNVSKWAGVLIVAFAISGCAQKARMNAMIFDVTDATVINDASPLYQQVNVEDVQGGEKPTRSGRRKSTIPNSQRR
ncbi:MAG: hypothetical protein ACTSW2_10925 [Alphaproteobacteria bacterium]